MNKVTSYRNEANGYADDADKADERGFKKLRYTINKLKSAFVRLIRVVRVSIDSCLSGYESFHHRGHRVSQSLINLKSKE